MAGRFTIDAVFRAIDRMTAPVGRIGARVENFAKKTSANLKAVNKVTGDIHSGLVRMGAAAVAAGAAIGVVAHNVLKTGAEFDQQMAAVGAVSLMTRDQIGDLEKKARELGATTKFSATEVASAMEMMGKAGFENQQILESISGVLNAAAAEGAELADTASNISNVLKGMGLEASQAGKVADVLALASARTNSSISSLGESMANVSATARQFNIPLEQVVGSVALLQDVGLDASVAGSALNTMLTQLAKPTDEMKWKMRRMGVAFQDAQHNMLPLPQVFENLSKASDKSGGNMDKVAFFADLVGLRGQKAAQNLADLFKSGKTNELFKELELAGGSAERMAKLRMDNVLGDFEELTGAVDDVKITLFDMNRGPLRGAIQGFTKWIEANKGLILTRTQEYIDGIVQNLPAIVRWTERIAKGVAVFYSIAAAVKVAKVSTDAYLLTAKGFGLASRAMRGMAEAAGLFNSEVHLAGGGLSAWRAKLNAGELSIKLEGITSKLGKAGLLGAALGVGVALGLWVREVLNTDKVISDLLLKIRGLEAEREEKLPKNVQEIKNGVRVNTVTGEWVNKPMPGATSKTYDEWFSKFQMTKGRRAFGLEGNMSKGHGAQIEMQSTEKKDPFLFPNSTPRMVSPQERTARTIEETNTTTTDKAEITVKAEAGRVEVTRKPKRTKLNVQHSGAL